MILSNFTLHTPHHAAIPLFVMSSQRDDIILMVSGLIGDHPPQGTYQILSHGGDRPGSSGLLQIALNYYPNLGWGFGETSLPTQFTYETDDLRLYARHLKQLWGGEPVVLEFGATTFGGRTMFQLHAQTPDKAQSIATLNIDNTMARFKLPFIYEPPLDAPLDIQLPSIADAMRMAEEFSLVWTGHNNVDLKTVDYRNRFF